MNNKIILDGCIKDYIKQNELNNDISNCFELFSVTQITKDYDISFDEIEDSIVDGGKDGGIDSIVVLLNDEYIMDLDNLNEIKFSKNSSLKILISQVKSQTSFKEDSLDKLLATIPFLLNLELNEEELNNRFNPQLVSKILLFHKIWFEVVKKGGAVQIEYYYFCKANEIQISPAFISKVKQLEKITQDKVNNSQVAFINVSSKELLDLFQKTKPNRLNLAFKEVPITTNYKNGFGYVGIVDLEDYFDFVSDEDGNIIESIFESNIRHYQGDVDVNNKIRDSLENEYDIDFWWLNNGITIIAEQPNQISKTLSIEHVQIVNGLQTTFTLHKYFNEIKKQEEANRSILIKVIILQDNQENKKGIDKIISSTNSQNAVPPVLLRATDNIQRKIEMYFFNKGYFYDRRKNFYKNSGKPSSKIFTIQTTAQAVQSIIYFEPDTARAKPTTLIKTKESYEKIFNENTDFEIYLKCSLFYRAIMNFIKLNLTTDDKSLAKAYSLHFSRVTTAFIIQKGYYSKIQFKNMDISLLDNAMCISAFDFLKDNIAEYKKTSSTIADNSLSKSGLFREYLNKKLNKKLN